MLKSKANSSVETIVVFSLAIFLFSVVFYSSESLKDEKSDYFDLLKCKNLASLIKRIYYEKTYIKLLFFNNDNISVKGNALSVNNVICYLDVPADDFFTNTDFYIIKGEKVHFE